jgi:hypothetical protein
MGFTKASPKSILREGGNPSHVIFDDARGESNHLLDSREGW